MMENLQKEYERIEKYAREVDTGKYDMRQCEVMAIMNCAPNLFMAIFVAFKFGFEKGCRKTKKAVKS